MTGQSISCQEGFQRADFPTGNLETIDLECKLPRRRTASSDASLTL
jgi:hypothetical protein